MNKVIIIICLVGVSCTKQFIPQPSRVREADLPAECKGLIALVNEHWYRHKKNPCHKEFTGALSLMFSYQSCFLHLQKADIISLFGEPDKKTPYNGYTYFLKQECGKNQSLNYASFQFTFSDNHVVKAEYGDHSIVW